MAEEQNIIYPLPSILEVIDYTRLFPRSQPVEVELGSGDGSFLVDYAAAHPDRNFIGIERLLGRLRKVGRKARRRLLQNLRAIRIESVYFTRYLLPGRSVQALHIYFPDPWPKRRHRQNRLINESFPKIAREVLADDGAVYLRTDDQDYFEQIRAVFDLSPLFQEVETPAELLAFKTDFERDFNARGIETLSIAYGVL
jgi:tRNA (guanine-N7-)-methyltransferase